MTAESNNPTPAPALIHEVLDVRRWERNDSGFRYEGLSRHGYVLQCTLGGVCRHMSSGRGYELKRGSVVWLDNLEGHACEVLKAPWVFCSVQLTAPSLVIPPEDRFTRRVSNATVDRFTRLLDLWQDDSVNPHVKALRVHALVARILADIICISEVQSYVVDETTKIWWDLEEQLRHRMDQPIQLADLEFLSGINRASLSQLCKQATGTSPMKRVKHLRLTHASSLLIGSDLLIKEIAAAVGYPRIHEFSRDFRQAYGVPATTYRSRGRPPGPQRPYGYLTDQHKP